MNFQTKTMPRKSEGWEYILTVMSKMHATGAVTADWKVRSQVKPQMKSNNVIQVLRYNPNMKIYNLLPLSVSISYISECVPVLGKKEK